MLVARVGQEIAQVLKKSNIVRDGVAVGKYPIRIVQIEMDQTGHVVPATEVQRKDMFTQMPSEFLHLIGERVRFNERHALDIVRRPSLPTRYGLKKSAPPHGLFGRLGLRDVKSERMFELSRVYLKRDQCHVKQRGANFFAFKNPGLAKMQSARPERNHCVARLDSNSAVALAIKIGKFAAQSCQDIRYALH